MKRTLTAMVIALVLAAVVHARAGLTGKWQGKTPNGFDLELDLTATGKTLTGTFTRNGQTLAIAGGQVSKNTFTFKATLDDRTDGFAGEVTGDELRVWLDRQGPERAAVLKRVKDLKRDAEVALTGKWHGTTASGRPLVLDLRVDGQQLTGRLTLAEQSADITEGKVEGQTFSLTAGPLDGRTAACNGRLVGDEIEFTVRGVGTPLTLKRVK